MRLCEITRRIVLPGLFLAVVVGQARAQDSTARPTGLPGKVRWTFNFDAGFGAFGFANSLYLNVKPDPSGDLSDNWIESFVRPSLSAVLPTGKSELYGKFSAAGERTFAAPPPLVGEEASSFQVEDASIGWRSGTALGLGENALDFVVGRTQYKIGHGLLLWDGGGEGGTRGGFWSNARKAWAFAAVGKLTTKHHTLEAFYLDRDEVPESETGTKLWGGNYELKLGEANTLGATYMKFQADPTIKASRDGLNVYNLRAYLAPFKGLSGLTFEAEWAQEDNGDLLKSTAWNGQIAYEFGGGWTPKLSYRYAFFEGDDPTTEVNEGFDSLIPGFYDWGTWWQGEIAGEYFLGNSNLISHQVRLHVAPADNLGMGLIGYVFQADQPASYGAGITSKNLVNEIDWYADWKLNGNFTVSLVAAFASPQDAVKQYTGRTDSFKYGMVYVAYSY